MGRTEKNLTRPSTGWPAKKWVKFNVPGSVHRNNILVYKFQQDAHVTEFIFV